MSTIMIRNHDVQMSDRLREQANQKLSKLDRYMPNITDIMLDVTRIKNSRGPDSIVAQITVRHERGAIIRAEERVVFDGESSTLAALSSALDHMHRRINRFKGRRRSQRERKQEKYQMTVEEMALSEDIPDMPFDQAGEAVDEAESDDYIIRRKTISIMPMDEEEAIEQMELLGHDFYMFFNADTSEINVVYRRRGRGYGLLEPEMA